MRFFLGVDLGTSSLKIILGNEKGRILGSTSSSFSISSPREGYSEENPQEWVAAFEIALMELIHRFPEIKDAPLTMGFSGQMHSLVLIDKAGNVLRPAILWNDGRTTEEVKELQQLVGEHLLKVEKNIPLEGFTLPKILWVQKHQPELWEKTWKFLLPKDYLVYYLTGKALTEPSDAAGTIMLDIEKQSWDTELLKGLSIPLDKCPEICPSTEIIGEMTSDLKKNFGLTGTVSLVLGGADNACGAFGNISNPKIQGLISVGTSGVVLVYETENNTDNLGKYHYSTSVLNDINYKMGVTLAAGYSLDWIKRLLGSEDSFVTFTKYAEESPIGSLGVTYLPYLFGERSPYFDPSLSGGLFGLKAHHQQSDIIRAVMEGIAFSLRNVYESMEIEKNKIEKFRITGGVVKNPFWLQMFADIFEAEIEVLSFDEGPAYGAMLCAVAGIQEDDLLIKWQQANKVKAIYKPTKQASLYEQAYEKFVGLSISQIENTFPSIKRKEIISK